MFEDKIPYTTIYDLEKNDRIYFIPAKPITCKITKWEKDEEETHLFNPHM